MDLCGGWISEMPPQKFEFGDLFGNEQKRGTPVVVKMENPNYDMLEIDSPTIAKGKGKNAKQMTWVLLLKANQAVGLLAWLASGVKTLVTAVKERLILRQNIVNQGDAAKGKLFQAITGFLIFALVMLCVEVGAHTVGWHLSVPHWPSSLNFSNVLHAIFMGWMYVRASYIAPALQKVTDFCICLFLLQSADRIILCIGAVYIKWKKIKPVPVNHSLESDDVEQPDKGYPMCLVQIPMCNEREVCDLHLDLDSSVVF